MAALVGRRVRATQPQQNPQIDWSNPITAGLVFAYTMGSEAVGWSEDGRAVVQYQKPDGTVVGLYINTATGTAVQTKLNVNATYSCSLGQSSAKAGSYSLFAFATGGTAAIQSALDDDDGVTRRFQLRMNANKAEFIPFYSGGNGSVAAATTVNGNDTTNGFAIGATVNGTSYSVFQKGVKASATLPSAALAPNTTISVGARKTNAQLWSAGGIQLVAMWNRPLTDAEHASLAENPWQLFKPAQRRLYMVHPPAVTTTELIPGAAAFTLAGAAPTLQQTANFDLSPGAASFNLAGLAPTIQQTAGVDLSPAPATLNLTGLVPSIQQTNSIDLSPAPATMTLSGAAPSIAQSTDTLLFPWPATLILDGAAPTLDQTTNKDLSPAPASLALAGQIPAVEQARMPADPRYARPIGDVSAGAWAASDGGYLSNAVAQDDSITMSASVPSACEIKLSPVVDPQTSTGQVVRYKAASSNGSGLTVRLKQGVAVVAQWTHDSLPAVDTMFTQSLTAAQCDSITDYGDLRFEFEAL